MILARTLKGKGVSFIEGKDGWHGKALKKGEEADKAIAELETQLVPAAARRSPRDPPSRPSKPREAARPTTRRCRAPAYKLGDLVATREAYGTALAALGAVDPPRRRARRRRQELDLQRQVREGASRSLLPELHRRAGDGRRGDGAGGARRDSVPVDVRLLPHARRRLHPHGGHLDRRHQLNIKLAGSHAGVSIGEDGPSQMALEDLAMMRAVPDCAVLYPCDAVSTERLVVEMAAYHGPGLHAHLAAEDAGHLRPDEQFPIGGSKVLRQSANDVATVVGAGVTVSRRSRRTMQLKGEGIPIRVIDAYSVQPIDAATLIAAGKATDGVIITVEDHYAAGGLGDAVSEAVAAAGLGVHRLAVREMPRSGQPEELLDRFGISARHIVDAVQAISLRPPRCSGAAAGARCFSLTVALTLRGPDAARRAAAREPAWAPDGKRLAFSYLDRIWISAPDGRNGKPLRPETSAIERDPRGRPTASSIVFAADAGQGFDLVVVPRAAAIPRRLTTLAGDERWPSWTLGRAHRVLAPRRAADGGCHVVDAAGGEPKPLFSDTAADDEQQGRVSPDGKRVAYVSDRDSDDGDRDLWVAELAPGRAIA